MYHRLIYACSLSQACYLVGGSDSPRTVVIDPPRDPREVLELLEADGRELVGILLSHTHADFVAGHLELTRTAGSGSVPIYVSALARVEYEHEILEEDAELELGSVVLRSFLTPGHTPDSMCWLALEDGAPVALYTGDTIFVDAVGRPDLVEGSTPSAQAGQLFDALQSKILTLPDAVRIYPGHGPGSMCGAGLSQKMDTTVGEQRATNPFFNCKDRADFVEKLTGDLPPRPMYFGRVVGLNRAGPPPRSEVTVQALKPEDVERLGGDASEGWILDLRERAEFAEAHLPGAVNVGWGDTFNTWFGAVVPEGASVVLHLPPDLGIEEVRARLQQIGVDRLAGFLDDDAWTQWRERSEPARIEVIDAQQGVRSILEGESDLHVLDVRNPREVAEDGISGATHVPLMELEERIEELSTSKRYGVLCRSGYRSMLAASLLRKRGDFDVVQLEGGILRVRGEGACQA